LRANSDHPHGAGAGRERSEQCSCASAGAEPNPAPPEEAHPVPFPRPSPKAGFVLSEGFLIDISSISGPNGAWPLRFDPVDNGWIVATQRDEQLLFTSTCAETLPLSKVTGLCRWRHAPLQEWARRTSSVPLPGVRPHDRTPKPWGRGAIRSATPTCRAFNFASSVCQTLTSRR